MNFMIEIRHIESGLAKVFHTVEELAAHLAANVKEEWEGWTHLRLHPALAALDEPAAAAPAPAPAATGSTRAFGWFTYGSLEVPVADVAAVAQVASGLTPEAWAALTDAERDAWVDSTYAGTKSQSAEETAAMFPNAQAIKDLASAAPAVGHDPAQDTTGS